MQGLFARIGSGDPVRVLRLFHNKYTGYCCIHLLCRATYNLSLPRLSANYYGLPTTVQLRAAHESRCSLVGVSRSTAQVLYCTCLERYNYGTVHGEGNVFTRVCHSVHRGGGLPSGGDRPPPCRPPSRQTPGRSSPGKPPFQIRQTPFQVRILWDTVNRRAVHILHECILTLH